jgi:hypothetical protein
MSYIRVYANSEVCPRRDAHSCNWKGTHGCNTLKPVPAFRSWIHTANISLDSVRMHTGR